MHTTFLMNNFFVFFQTMIMDKDYLEQLKNDFGQWSDFRVRTFCKGNTLHVVTLESMSNDDKISDFLLRPLALSNELGCEQDLLNVMSSAGIECVNSYENVKTLFLAGNAILLFLDKAYYVDTHLTLGRAIVEPPTSSTVRGPREGFVEDMKSNLTLIRKRLKSEDFVVKTLTIGKYTKTDVAVCFLKSVASIDVVEKIIQTVMQIDVDGIIDSSQVASFLDTENTFLFKRVGTCEKPDVAVGKMLEGRVALIVDGSPMVLTLPYLFIEDLQSATDYHENDKLSSLSRFLRLIAMIASVLLPGIYVSLQRYNYQIIPIKFLITILNSTQAIPFSPLSEMLFVLIIFDVLRESSFRMPKAAGMSLSLVGAVVLGDAAVKAGLLGAPAVMVAALSGIGLYSMPDNSPLFSMLRLVFTFLGGTMGLLGVLLVLLALCCYCVSLKNYSSFFLSPLAPNAPSDRQDAIFMQPFKQRKQRPKSIKNENKTRQGSGADYEE